MPKHYYNVLCETVTWMIFVTQVWLLESQSQKHSFSKCTTAFTQVMLQSETRSPSEETDPCTLLPCLPDLVYCKACPFLQSTMKKNRSPFNFCTEGVTGRLASEKTLSPQRLDVLQLCPENGTPENDFSAKDN